MIAGLCCPIRFNSPVDLPQSLDDMCLTAAEIEWRRWSAWQTERSLRRRLEKKRYR
jgi:hypothetical protein